MIRNFRMVNKSSIVQLAMLSNLQNYRNLHGNQNEWVVTFISKPIPPRENYDIRNWSKKRRRNDTQYDQVCWINMAELNILLYLQMSYLNRRNNLWSIQKQEKLSRVLKRRQQNLDTLKMVLPLIIISADFSVR